MLHSGNRNTGNKTRTLDSGSSPVEDGTKSFSQTILHPKLLSGLTLLFEVKGRKNPPPPPRCPEKTNSELFFHISIIPFCL